MIPIIMNKGTAAKRLLRHNGIELESHQIENYLAESDKAEYESEKN